MRLVVLCGLALAPALALADGPVFEAASVKLSSPDVPQPFMIAGGPGTSDPSQFRATRITMIALLARAFNVESDEIAGPSWLRDMSGGANYYNIAAVIPAGVTRDQFRQMLQNLLVERFHLTFHRETREFPGYELVVDAGGPKFKEVSSPQDPAPAQKIDTLATMNSAPASDGFPKFPPGSRITSQSFARGVTRVKYEEQTMQEFASHLGSAIGSSQGKSVTERHPRVADKTGLSGKYTFILEYRDATAAKIRIVSTSGEANQVTQSPDPPAAPSIFEAVQKQLGLRLEKTSAVPLELMVIDNIDKLPTEN